MIFSKQKESLNTCAMRLVLIIYCNKQLKEANT